MNYNAGETIEAYLEHKNLAGAFVDPTSQVITITDPADTVKVNAVSMGKTAVGKYSHFYKLDANCLLGWWKASVTIVDNTHTIIELSGFRVS